MCYEDYLDSNIDIPSEDEIKEAIRELNDKRYRYYGLTVGQIYNTFDDVQKVVMWYLISKIVDEVQEDQNED